MSPSVTSRPFLLFGGWWPHSAKQHRTSFGGRLALLATLVLLAAAACRSDRGVGLGGIALGEADVPSGWQPVDLDEGQVQGLWRLLPNVLTHNSDARLFVSAYRAEDGLEGAASVLVEAAEPSALPGDVTSQDAAGPLSRLLTAEEALLGPEVRAGDPGAYVAATDEPVPRSLRSRLVRLTADDRLLWDSVTFRDDRMLVIATVWYPESRGPFRPVEDVAIAVQQRISAANAQAPAE